MRTTKNINPLVQFVFVFFLLLIACKKDTDDATPKSPPKTEGYQPTPYYIDLPPHFESLIGQAPFHEDNPLTVEGVELGRKLYYEEKLSKGGPLEGKACASCHHQDKSFSVPDKFPNYNNVMPHFNLAWTKNYLWEGGIAGLMEDVTLFEVRDFFQTDLKAIKEDTQYKKDFKAAFGTDSITYKEASYALAQFMRTMITGNTRYDNYIQMLFFREPIEGEILKEQELRGLEIYLSEGKGDCFHCHGDLSNPLLTDFAFKNNGLDFNPDSGYAKTTKNPNDIGKFKTPSLRNLVFTAPYMHDGRFETLREVVDFYADDVQFSSPNIDGVMFKPRVMNEQEREDLVAFLEALSDSSYIVNPKLSRP